MNTFFDILAVYGTIAVVYAVIKAFVYLNHHRSDITTVEAMGQIVFAAIGSGIGWPIHMVRIWLHHLGIVHYPALVVYMSK